MGNPSRKKQFIESLVCFIWLCWFCPVVSASPISLTYTVTPELDTITTERHPLITWTFVTPVPPQAVQLFMDEQPVMAWWNLIHDTLSYQPPLELGTGYHLMRCELFFVGYEPMRLESRFEIVIPPVQPAAPSEEWIHLREAALHMLNQFRLHLKLQPLNLQKQLNEAAQSHSDYISRYFPKTVTLNIHQERLENAGYTGKNAAERAAYFGYFGSIGEIIDPGGAFTPEQGVTGLIDSPYHRLVLLNPYYRDIGIGLSSQEKGSNDILVIDTATRDLISPAHTAEGDNLVTYPDEAQINTKLGWYVSEVPNPLRFFGVDGQFVGYPITVGVYAPEIKEIQLINASIQDEQGREVAAYLVDSVLDTSKRHLFIIPKAPLNFNTTYHVAVKACLLYADDSARLWEKSWQYRTVSSLDIETMTIELSPLEMGGKAELLRLSLTCGDLPDMTYELIPVAQNSWIQRWDNATKRFSFYDRVLAAGRYDLVLSAQGLERHIPVAILNVNGKKQIVRQDS